MKVINMRLRPETSPELKEESGNGNNTVDASETFDKEIPEISQQRTV